MTLNVKVTLRVMLFMKGQKSLSGMGQSGYNGMVLL